MSKKNLSDDLNSLIAKSQEKELTQEEKNALEKERKRLCRINNTRVKRYRKRRKLKDAVADFLNRLHLYTANHLDKTTLSMIEVDLRHILKLPYNWTDNDLTLAFNALQKLEKKYLGLPRSGIPKNRATLENKLTTLITQSKLSSEERLTAVLSVLDNIATELLTKADELEPTRNHTIMLLSQTLDNAVPSWFEDAFIELLAEKYTGDNLVRVMLKLHKVLTDKRIEENSLTRLERVLAEEED